MIIIQANGAEGDLEEKILAFLRREDIAAERVSLSSGHTLTFPELTIDGRSQQAFQNGTALALTRIEFNMLLFLASNPGVTLSKEDLFFAVWGQDSADNIVVKIEGKYWLYENYHNTDLDGNPDGYDPLPNNQTSGEEVSEQDPAAN